VEESKKINEELEVQLLAKVKNCSNLKEEIVGIRMQLEEVIKKISSYEYLEGRSRKVIKTIFREVQFGI